MKLNLIALGCLGLSVSTFAVQTADKPLSTLTSGDVKPNIMFTIDDSGSMAWTHMPDSVGGYGTLTTAYPDLLSKVGYRASLCNGVYYNPAITYQAPKNANGTSMPDATFTAAWYNGFSSGSTTTHNLSNAFFAYDNTTSYGRGTSTSVQAFYWALKSGVTFNSGNPGPQCAEVPSGSIDTNSAATTTSWTKVRIPDTSLTAAEQTAQKTNFANWFSYYRTRLLMMKSSAGLAFSNIDTRYRVGFSRIGRLKVGDYSSGIFLNINDYDGTQKSAWYSRLYGTTTGPDGTPLKLALQAIGEIYAGSLPSGVTDPIQYTCQQNFEILTTDGYWNATGDSVSVGNTDSSSGIPRPMLDGANQSNNLADVAMKYFKTDLRTNMANNVPGVLAFDTGPEGRQMMRTYTLGMGMNGTLKYVSDYETNGDASVNDYVGLKSGTKNWPTVTGETLTTIDDLWHAGVNGGGKFFSARDPNAVSSSLQSALNDISARLGSVGAPDVSNAFMTAADNKVYNSSYKTRDWTGDVLARSVDVTSSTFTTTALWSAQDLLATRNLSSNPRAIYSCTGSCTSFTTFNATTYASNTDITAGVNSLKTANSLNAAQIAAIDGTKLVNYLRGDQSNEPTTAAPDLALTTALFRQRTKTLGSIIHGGVSYVKKSEKAYADAGYGAFSRTNLSRRAMLYSPANDGMLHAFDATTGQEIWAFIPPSLLPSMWKQADRNYDSNFQYFVDGSPTIADIYAGGWKTILIGGLRGGGGEYYAIDITNPSATVPAAPLWSFKDSKLGKTYGFPVVGKIAGQWKVLLSSGYDNSDNKGYVFVLDANTGALEKTFTTSCTATDGTCGISKIGALFTESDVDDTIKMAYAGDLAGNLWRFDVNGAGGAAVLVATTGTSTLRQPISSAPLIKEVPAYKNVGGIAAHYVNFGTGRFLNQNDMSTIDTQTIYGLIVDPSLGSIDSSFSNLRSSGSLIELVIDKTCDKTIKDNLNGLVTSLDGIDGNSLSNVCPNSVAGDFSNGDGNFDTITLKRTANTALGTDLTSCKNNTKGWRANLPISKERIPNDPFPFDTFGVFTSIVPGADSCTPGGISREYKMPLSLSKDWLCANPSSNAYISIGKNVDGTLSDDLSRRVTITTNKLDSILVNPDPTKPSTNIDAKLKRQVQGKRSSWSEILR
ncbi:PilC/PilY family type IV pilus protein [Iodobacter sp. CM08]|uniref:pilus assembly protein n=1 Tax=Iodobacter sp. CM08 TaxID=3085902 RepID=UPI002981287C|nr:PilC/PilY family type IV pilus protein [Iodobacter sp. CM08]MDW5417904.1 PilC/PilY family type IV pilus protein [Iodobacter sp. CM08]